MFGYMTELSTVDIVREEEITANGIVTYFYCATLCYGCGNWQGCWGSPPPPPPPNVKFWKVPWDAISCILGAFVVYLNKIQMKRGGDGFAATPKSTDVIT